MMSEQNDWNKQVIAEFRENGGKVGGHFKGWDLLLLHTTGAKSGLERVTPLVCMAEGDNLFVIASKGGASTHPDWYYNLKANPGVEVEFGRERFVAEAVEVEGARRAELYERMAKRHSFFYDYAEKAGRVIPVILLERG
ncbi:MAG TPA: nitroreductase family deazaflavin-dependent oxidoreductase [Anaerolineae bacterium]|nr:nitroreductase family deazaflavin-dependent oxidoreductase [Anaerolineae bacterium]